MAATAVAQPVNIMRDDHMMDTRTPSPVQRSAGSEGQDSADSEAYKPDLSQEVSMLSTKLINAINYQTNLDDTLHSTRHELEQSQQDLRRVRAEKQSLEDAISQGILLKKSEVDKTIAELRAELAQEKASRETAEKAKRETDGELENLTANLFEEANKMVSDARKDTEAVERRNSQLKNQIKDTEMLMASQQEQLQDLKLTMEKLERVETRDTSVPTTPINSATAVFDAAHLSPGAVAQSDVPPDHPLHFSSLIVPVLRTDVASYTEFGELLSWARKGALHSRSASGNMASASQTNLNTTSTSISATMSSPNLPGAFSFGAAGVANANSSPSSPTLITPPLKESKFYKRVLVEDLEPTLRLDLAPGLTFLSRRTVNSALLNGNLSIEPFTPRFKLYSPIFACALCGESRKQEPYIRRHRFRTSESEDAQRYPLCAFCLERVRSSADFVGFLRNVRDGHWRCGNDTEEGKAWEESVRLRERMFWARVGGGVVPAVQLRAQKTNGGDGKASLEDIPEKEGRSEEAGEVFEEREGEGESEEGIGRAIVSMAARAASTAVPELQRPPQRMSGSQSAGAVEASLNAQQSESQSQQDQIDAEAQLKREASATTEEMTTPPETPAPQPDDGPSQPEVSAAPSTPQAPEEAQEKASSRPSSTSRPLSATAESQEKPSSRPSSTSRPPSASSRRSQSPQKGGGGASSVLARVRAMEAKKST